jgi:hypothetical protein
MDSSVSPKDETWFLRVCHHISNVVYHIHHLPPPTLLLFISGNYRLGRYLTNAGGNLWVFAWQRYETYRLLSRRGGVTLVTVPAPNVLAVDAFGTGIFRWHLVP